MEESICIPNDFSSSFGHLKCPERKRKQNHGSVVLTISHYITEVKGKAAERQQNRS
jgi:hypothetical protein